MSDFFSKLTKAADAFADVITEDLKSDPSVKTYTYEDFKNLVNFKRKEYPQISKCTISVQIKKEFDNLVFSTDKYVIRIVMLDAERRPIIANNSKDEYVGALVFADSIDKRLGGFMGEKTEKTVVIGGK